MKKYIVGIIIGALALALAVNTVQAVPTFGTFGPSSDDFGGSGIPNDAVAQTTIVDGNLTVQLNATWHQRYSNPALENDGAGSFWGVTGGDGANGQPGYAKQNFGYSVNFTPDVSNFSPSPYTVRLYFDKDPTAGNALTSFLLLEPNFFNGTTFDSKNSLNLGMTSLFGSGFNPVVEGQYAIALALFKYDTELGRVETVLNVNSTGTRPDSVPDGGSSLAMLGIAVTSLGFNRRKRS